MCIAAFFDVDGTLYRDSLMVEHFKKLIKYEVLDPAIWHGSAKKKFENWAKRHGDYEDFLLEIANIHISHLKGIDKDYINFITEQVVSLKGDRVYRFTRDRINWHKKQGHMVIFVSGSPSFILEKMAEKYDVKLYKGTEYLVDEENKFTGELIPMWESESKMVAIDEFVRKYNIDLEKSYSYGDTNGDYDMLKIVGHPVLINPIKKLVDRVQKDQELMDKAEFIVERKDVIYKIPSNVETL
ncbi:HAD superfamily hydrolase (TIGR01490 family) [Alkalibaculum bacchi]|uniref:phosphoserine phosphatase n=1 Tax=Alkalibaculum bacchi TaxID=645887 RepID=A0A366I8Q8_9FIRM|nr:HAD-IB family hydrolase [Alkalibaculum bacchi]RBP65402.1 HAD superfamily hydrolase (TIGR01490 family) [Alkalibaculum bacchi]